MLDFITNISPRKLIYTANAVYMDATEENYFEIIIKVFSKSVEMVKTEGLSDGEGMYLWVHSLL